MMATAREKSPAPFGAGRIDAGRDRVGKFLKPGSAGKNTEKAIRWRITGGQSLSGRLAPFSFKEIHMITVKELIGPKFDIIMDHIAEWSKHNLDNIISIESTIAQDDRQDFIIAACAAFGRTDPFLTCFLGQVMLTYASFISDKNATIDTVMSQNECLSRILLLARSMKFILENDRKFFDLVITGLNILIHKNTFGIQSAIQYIDVKLLDDTIIAIEFFLDEMRKIRNEDYGRRNKNV